MKKKIMVENWFHAFGLSVQYFSRIPLPFSFRYEEEIRQKSIFFLPLLGIVIGGLLFLFYQWLHSYFPVPLFSVFLILFLLWLTGALHADGWMDVSDGIGSSQSKERMLEIMKDSRVGSMGVVGFVALFAIKMTSLMELLETDHFLLEALLITPLLARWGVLLAVSLFPYAREKGLGKEFKVWLTWPKIVLSLLWLIPFFWLSRYIFLMLLIIIIFVLISGLNFTKKLGGLTGDVYGWMIEGGEALLWLVLVFLA